MWDWFSKIDPNVIVGLAVAAGGYVWKHLFAPSTRAQVASAVATAQQTALDVADKVMAGLALAAELEGKSREDLQHQLWAAAKVQLGHIGLNPDALPAAVTAAINALVSKYLAGYKPKA